MEWMIPYVSFIIFWVGRNFMRKVDIYGVLDLAPELSSHCLTNNKSKTQINAEDISN